MRRRRIAAMLVLAAMAATAVAGASAADQKPFEQLPPAAARAPHEAMPQRDPVHYRSAIYGDEVHVAHYPRRWYGYRPYYRPGYRSYAYRPLYYAYRPPYWSYPRLYRYPGYYYGPRFYGGWGYYW